MNMFGAPGRAVNPDSMRQLMLACKEKGLVLDKDSKLCRESKKGAKRSDGPTQKEMMAECRAQGLVFDRETKQCRPSKKGLSGLERAYARGSLFNFGVMQPAFAQRPGQVMASTGARTILVDKIDMPTKEEFAKTIKEAQRIAKLIAATEKAQRDRRRAAAQAKMEAKK